jgi:hypothetical protein
MEENKTTEFIKEVPVTITGIEVETNPQEVLEVKRIKFITDKGDITFKPKVEKETYQDGMKILSTVPVNTNEIPEEIRAVAKTIQTKGSIKMLVNYTLMKTMQDNEPKEYRFITSMKTFKEWKDITD